MIRSRCREFNTSSNASMFTPATMVRERRSVGSCAGRMNTLVSNLAWSRRREALSAYRKIRISPRAIGIRVPSTANGASRTVFAESRCTLSPARSMLLSTEHIAHCPSAGQVVSPLTAGRARIGPELSWAERSFAPQATSSAISTRLRRCLMPVAATELTSWIGGQP